MYSEEEIGLNNTHRRMYVDDVTRTILFFKINLTYVIDFFKRLRSLRVILIIDCRRGESAFV